MGYLLIVPGIKANLVQIEAIDEMLQPKLVKDVKKIIGRLAALNMFISRYTNKCSPRFKILVP